MREAVRRAAEGGLLVLRPNQAPVVRPLNIEDVWALYDLREVLEVHALDLAWTVLAGPAGPKRSSPWLIAPRLEAVVGSAAACSSTWHYTAGGPNIAAIAGYRPTWSGTTFFCSYSSAG